MVECLTIMCEYDFLFLKIFYLSTTLSMVDLEEDYGAITPSLLATLSNTKE